jgi:hypothetical protein
MFVAKNVFNSSKDSPSTKSQSIRAKSFAFGLPRRKVFKRLTVAWLNRTFERKKGAFERFVGIVKVPLLERRCETVINLIIVLAQLK